MQALRRRIPIARLWLQKHRRVIQIGGGLFGALLFWLVFPLRPIEAPYSVVLEDVGGDLLGAVIASDEQWRFPPADSVPTKFAKALLLYEDKRFWKHHGVDPFAIGRAVKLNFAKGEVKSGASTLTMQLMRMAHPHKRRTFVRKVQESLNALKWEVHFSKEEILNQYATHAPFGGNVVGLSAAAWRYFGRSPQTLSWAEATMLAVLPNAPSLIHPGKNRERLLQKRNTLLDRLHEAGEIDALTAELAKEETLPPKPLPLPMIAPHLLFRLQAEGGSGGGRYRTTLDGDLQKSVNDLLASWQRKMRGNEVYNGAVLVVDVRTNEVLSYVGNLSPFDLKGHDYHVDIIQAPRSSGSILKPFLYAGLLREGTLLPTQLIPDVPTRMGSFAPQNYTKTYDGAVPAASALARSLNVPAVRELRQYGVGRFHKLLTDMGVSTLTRTADEYGLSLILGGAEVSLWDMVSLYGGMVRTMNQYESSYVVDANAYEYPNYLQGAPKKRSREVNPLEPAETYLTLQALLEVARPGDEMAWQRFSSSKKIAWKTGTSFGMRDAWAVGVTPDYVVGVWVGNADGVGRPELTGVGAAAPLLFDVFGKLPTGKWFTSPQREMSEVSVCAKSGFRKGPNCNSSTKIDVTKSAVERSVGCPYCRLVHLDATEQYRVTSECSTISEMVMKKWFVLPPRLAWYYNRTRAGYRALPPLQKGCKEDNRLRSLSILYPEQDASVFVPLELDGTPGRVVFEATHRSKNVSLYWYLDDEFRGTSNDLHQKEFYPKAGEHTVTVVDEYGETSVTTFSVLARE